MKDDSTGLQHSLKVIFTWSDGMCDRIAFRF